MSRAAGSGRDCVGAEQGSVSGPDEPAPTPEEALKLLMDGNAHYTASKKPCFDLRELEPEGSEKNQKPIAVVICCSDSRVPAELIFWQGRGRLFVTRVAGNTVDAASMASITYAVIKFRTPLILVLGHERCGAVAEAVKFVRDGESYDPIMASIVEPIVPAVVAARRNPHEPGDLEELANAESVRRTVDRLRTAFAARVEGKDPPLLVVGARYDLNTGKVEVKYRPRPSPMVVAQASPVHVSAAETSSPPPRP